MKRLERLLLLSGVMCHLVGMPLAEWADVRWFGLVLVGEMLLGAYVQAGRKGKMHEKAGI